MPRPAASEPTDTASQPVPVDLGPVPPQLPRGKRCLMVASTGGHLAQLDIFSRLLDVHPGSHWVTFPNAQSASLLRGREHTLVPYVGPRQLGAALRTTGTFVRLLGSRRRRFEAVISTGAAIAVPALVVAALLGRPAYYVESVSRVRGPSLTGRILRRVPGVTTFTQHPTWRSRAWHHDVSVFDAFVDLEGRPAARVPSPAPAPDRELKVFITLGTIRPYRFDALVDAVLAATAGTAVRTTWQLGTTVRDDLPGVVHGEMGAEQFETEAASADLVITHAGVATCLRLVQMGIRPVIVPRRASRGEHVDDHQTQIAAELAQRDLCLCVEAPSLDRRTLRL